MCSRWLRTLTPMWCNGLGLRGLSQVRMANVVCGVMSCESPAVVWLQGYALCDRHCGELADKSKRLNQPPERVLAAWAAIPDELPRRGAVEALSRVRGSSGRTSECASC